MLTELFTCSLVAGDVKGRFSQLYARVAAVNASHGPFACVFCVGDFLGPEEQLAAALEPYLSGVAQPALKTYFSSPAFSSPPLTPAVSAEGETPLSEIAPGIAYLGESGITTLHHLDIAFVSRSEGGAEGIASLLAKKGEPSHRGCDLLLTHEWPRGFFRNLPEASLSADLLPDSNLPDVGSEVVSEVVCALRPRYHFCAGEAQFWQRAPHRQGAGCAHVCRMVALAGVPADKGGGKKQKWLHALSLLPMRTMASAVLAHAPAETTDCPYPYAPALAAEAEQRLSGQKRPRPDFVKDERGWITQSCWFCLASPNFESFLVASVGEDVYTCLAKGPLVPNHALVIPIAHRACSLQLSEAEGVELRKYVSALTRAFSSVGQGCVCFERFMCNSQFEHMHLQIVPLPHQLAQGAAAAFKTHGERIGIKFELLPAGVSLASRMPKPEPFFRVELPDGSQLLHRMTTNPRKHPLQFGRQVASAALPRLNQMPPPDGIGYLPEISSIASPRWNQLPRPRESVASPRQNQ